VISFRQTSGRKFSRVMCPVWLFIYFQSLSNHLSNGENIITLKEYSTIPAAEQDTTVQDNLFEYFYHGYADGFQDKN